MNRFERQEMYEKDHEVGKYKKDNKKKLKQEKVIKKVINNGNNLCDDTSLYDWLILCFKLFSRSIKCYGKKQNKFKSNRSI